MDEESKETRYKPEQLSIVTSYYQPAVPCEQPQSEKEEELKANSKCSCCVWLGFVAVITYTVLALIFGILFIVLTAIGKENISLHEGSKYCNCELFAPSVGYGLGLTLLIEVGLEVSIIIIFILASIGEALKKLFDHCFVIGGLLAFNYVCFLCIILTIIAMGGICCSVVVAGLSGLIVAFKFVIIYVYICHS